MSAYGPRAVHGAATLSHVGVHSASGTARTGFDVMNGPSSHGAFDAQIAMNGVVKGRLGSQHSVSSGINSFGPQHEERTSLGRSEGAVMNKLSYDLGVGNQ